LSAPRNRVAALFAAAAALAALAGCDTPCHALGYQVCACETSAALKQDCEKRVRDALTQKPPTTDEQAACRALEPECTAALSPAKDGCAALRTDDGKRACGIAF
jgi:hypothetical protein